MIELIYPAEGLPPVIPPTTSKTAGRSGRLKGEVFPVITPEGLVIGRATREYCHSGSNVLHPVVHLHLIDRQGRIYLQKRSMKKDLQPGKWDTAVGGHVVFGESIIEALHREAAEELNLTQYNPIYLCSYTYYTGRDSEFVNAFAAVGSYKPHPDGVEVTEGRWWPISEIESNAAAGIFTPNFLSEFEMIKAQLLSLL